MMRWSLWRRKQQEADLEDEIRYDLALEAEEKIQSGMPREEAERRSERDFGNVLVVKEGVREMWGWTSLERLAQDLRYGWRTLRKSPSFTAMAALSLALGIGANTAIYSFMDAILMRSLPVSHPQELVIFKWHAKDLPAVAHSLSGSWHSDPRTGWTGSSFPFPAFDSLRTNGAVLSGAFARTGARLNLMAQGEAGIGNVQFVSGGFFSALGVPPSAGRLIGEDDDRFGAAPVAMITSGRVAASSCASAASCSVGPVRVSTTRFFPSVKPSLASSGNTPARIRSNVPALGDRRPRR